MYNVLKRKNKLKSVADSCFICGKDLIELEDKYGHRINPKKGNGEYNLLIVCKDCKRNILNKLKIFEIEFDKVALFKYFKKLGFESKKIILNKIKIMKNKNMDVSE